MFIRLGDSLVNSQHVRKLRVRHREKGASIGIDNVDGGHETVDCPGGFDDLPLTGGLVPAPPGYFLLHYASAFDDPKGEASDVYPEPIIAFMIAHGEARPVVVSGPAPDHWPIAILLPDGKVDIVEDRTLDSIAEFKAYRDKLHRDDLKRA